MEHPERPDIIPLLRHLCLALKPFVAINKNEIFYTTTTETVSFSHHPYEIISGLSKILCTIISYLPQESSIAVSSSVINTAAGQIFEVTIHNTGINLSRVTEVTDNCKFSVSVKSLPGNETIFFIHFPLYSITDKTLISTEKTSQGSKCPVFFDEVRSRLQRHFIRMGGTNGQLNESSPKDAAFLRTINKCIFDNLSNELFDTAALSKTMAMSRTQLFRRLKPIIHQSAGSYIKAMRLQKAKELLETRDLTVSEVACETGFKTCSHFTKVFAEKYGIRPSVLRKPKVL